MKNMIFIGGDVRFLHAAGCLREKYDCAVYGMENASDKYGLRRYTDGERFDMAVLPVFARSDTIPFPLSEKEAPELSEIPGMVRPGGIVFAGKCPESLKKICAENSIGLCDYIAREDLAVMNAVLTAEGAVSIAVRETDTALHGSCVLVLGFGRIGKLCAGYFASLGAKVVCAARKSADIAWIRAYGYSPVSFYDNDGLVSALEDADIILNTAPAPIITAELAEKTKKSALLIELASVSCTDEGARKRIRVINAGGLPGKFSPVTAGKLIAETIENILTERSMNNGGA